MFLRKFTAGSRRINEPLNTLCSESPRWLIVFCARFKRSYARKKGAHCLKQPFFFLTLQGHFKFKVKFKVNKVARSSHFVKGYLVLKFGWSIVSRTKILYYHSQTHNFQKSRSRRLEEYLDRIWSNSAQQWIFGKHFRVFGSAFSKWTILFRDTRPLAKLSCNLFAMILQQFGPLDLGMTLILKVNGSTRDPSNKKGSIGLSCIVTQ